MSSCLMQSISSLDKLSTSVENKELNAQKSVDEAIRALKALSRLSIDYYDYF